MKILDKIKKFHELEKEIHEYFGYREDWVVIPIENTTNMYWTIIDNDAVRYAYTQKEVIDTNDELEYYEDMIYKQRFLPQWVYEKEDYTMVCCDTGVDGNKFLRIFDNEKKVEL